MYNNTYYLTERIEELKTLIKCYPGILIEWSSFIRSKTISVLTYSTLGRLRSVSIRSNKFHNLNLIINGFFYSGIIRIYTIKKRNYFF